MRSWTSAMIFIFLFLTNPVASFYIIRPLGFSDTSSYHDNPAISPLTIMNTNTALLHFPTKHTPDLPESYSPSSSSAKRLVHTFPHSEFNTMSGRLPQFY
uniref:Secreted protein n=1 Tax=Heterorhabditis bacteriophora TaxID=37862 RepID=A0A1I7XT90_HETBA